MKTITLLSQKGGSGKTTLSLNLAIAAVEDGKQVLVIDLDPQESAGRWSRLRKNENPVIVSGQHQQLRDMLERSEAAGADLVLIDTAPKSEAAALAAAICSDLIVIPCRASSLDLDAVGDSVHVAGLAQKPALFVLNDCRSSSTLPAMAMEALKDYGCPIAPVQIGSRVGFIKSLTEGKGIIEYELRSNSAQEIRALYKFICQQDCM